MKLIAPDYYGEFACIKGNCRHSCCIGWEIDVDEDSLAYYQSLEGDFARRIQDSIASEDGCAHFILGEDERCPFLNGDGLCDMILNLGEDSLCQICDDHPRFRNFYGDREEIGLGLCCEEATRLILTRSEAVRFDMIETDGEEGTLTADEAQALELRDELIGIAQDRRFSMAQRIERLLLHAGIDLGEPDWAHWRDFFKGLERLDDGWLRRLDCLTEMPAADCGHETAFEQLAVYLLYRHVNAADDDLAGRIAFCALCWRCLRKMHQDGDVAELIELARMFSSEIEYSDENTAEIIDEIHRLYPEI